MAGKRSYNEACGVARALDIVGERWALMVVRELLLGPKRFTDLRASLPGLSADVLSQRLRELESNGVLSKATLPPPAASKVYELTPMGFALEPVLVALGRWGGANAPAPAPGVGMSPDAHLISLRTLFEPGLAEDFDAAIDLRLGDERFRAVVADGQITVEHGDAPRPDAIVTTDHSTLLGLVRGFVELSDARGSRAITIDGDEAAVERFLGLFPLPPAATPVHA